MAMGLSQVISLDLIFCNEQDGDYQEVEELLVVPLSWTDHYLVGV